MQVIRACYQMWPSRFQRNSCLIAVQAASRQATDDYSVLKEGKGDKPQGHAPPLPVIVVDEVLNCSVQQLWHIVCKPDPVFQNTIHKLSGNRDIQSTEWHQQGDVPVPDLRNEDGFCYIRTNSFQFVLYSSRYIRLKRLSVCDSTTLTSFVQYRIYCFKVLHVSILYSLYMVMGADVCCSCHTPRCMQTCCLFVFLHLHTG